MSLLRHPVAGAVARALLAAGGLTAAAGFAAWPLATGCFAALSALTLGQVRAAQRSASEHRRVSTHDPLTSAGDFRALHERLHETVAADPRRFALLTLDADSFKQITDMHGPLEGDRLIQEVGRVLRESVEEIGVAVFPQDGATPDDLLQKADVQLRHAKAQPRREHTPA